MGILERGLLSVVEIGLVVFFYIALLGGVTIVAGLLLAVPIFIFAKFWGYL